MKHWREDVVAGLTTAVLLVPQAMAYALLAGLPPVVGLYASTLPILAYALIGSSRELAVGPVAMDSLLVAAALGSLAVSGSADYMSLAIMLALMVGGIQLTLALVRAGALIDLLHRSAISGFTSAAAILIALSQASNLLGVSLPRTQYAWRTIAALPYELINVHGPTLALGIVGYVIMQVLRAKAPRVPRALVVVVFGSLLAWGGVAAMGVAIVGDIPAGLPSLAIPNLDVDGAISLLPSAVLIAVIGLMEAAAIAQSIADKAGYEIKPSRELFGLGAANVAASLVGGYPVTGGFSRSAVNASAGARSRWASVVTALAIAAVLLLLTEWFYFVPKAALAAIIISAVGGLIDLALPRELWKRDRLDFALLFATFVATMAGGIGAGMLAVLVTSAVHKFRPKPKTSGEPDAATPIVRP